MGRVRAWVKKRGAKKQLLREQKAQKLLKEHCQNALVALRSGGLRCIFGNWFQKSKELAWKNPSAARSIIKTIQRQEKTGVRGVETVINGIPKTLTTRAAVEDLKAAAEGKPDVPKEELRLGWPIPILLDYNPKKISGKATTST